MREIQTAIEQMTDAERRQYLSESLFLNFVSYENERLGAYLKKLGQRRREPAQASAAARACASGQSRPPAPLRPPDSSGNDLCR